MRQPGHARQIAKVFWFFFSKKNKLCLMRVETATRPKV
jgi:hypothetical protein